MHSLRLSRLKQPGANVIGAALFAAALVLFGLIAEVNAASGTTIDPATATAFNISADK